MTRYTLLRLGSATVLVAGLSMLRLAQSPQNDASAAVPAGEVVATGDVASPERRALSSGDSIVLDISAMVPQLDSLRADEREDQVADWAVYGTLFDAPENAADLREALYDKVPLRLAGLDAMANFDYGPGRRIIRKNGDVWLFYAASAPREVTLARLADQVRMELGVIPNHFAVFRMRSDVSGGAVMVRREADVDGAGMFSPAFGYVQSTVRTADDLRRWLDSADDVSHFRLLSDGVELGGRRFAAARTAGVSMDDLAALYQAHTTLERRNSDSESLPSSGDAGALNEAFKRLIAVFNANVDRYNTTRVTFFSGEEFFEALN